MGEKISIARLSIGSRSNSQNISVIIPVLNERDGLEALARHIDLFYFGEVIYVDGGSDDGSWEWLQENVACAIQSDTGRGKQMNAGAKTASKDFLLFMHADTKLPQQVTQQIIKGLSSRSWGRFDVQFRGKDWFMPVVASCMNLRSKLTGICTGDQGLFIKRDVFWGVHGFDEIPLMEDVEITTRLKSVSKPFCSSARIRTSSRRWLNNGKINTILLMWKLRWKFYRGESADSLKQYYRDDVR